MPIDEIAPPPPTLLSLEEVFAAVLRLIEDDSLSGRVLVLVGGEEPALPVTQPDYRPLRSINSIR